MKELAFVLNSCLLDALSTDPSTENYGWFTMMVCDCRGRFESVVTGLLSLP